LSLSRAQGMNREEIHNIFKHWTQFWKKTIFQISLKAYSMLTNPVFR
jgi:hypothetical protein